MNVPCPPCPPRPSPKAEPFKQWLARVGYERLEEIENPELSMERMQALYEKKGYPKEWIDKRMRGIAVRQDLTDEWKSRGATTSLEYAITGIPRDSILPGRMPRMAASWPEGRERILRSRQAGGNQ